MPRKKSTPTCGHPGREHFGRGFCYPCYVVWLRESGEGKRRQRDYVSRNREEVWARAREHNRKAYAHPDGRRRRAVRECRFKAKYGITIAEYDRLWFLQGGLCAICQQPETAKQRYGLKRLCVDHEHVSGRVRGLLCQRCNQMIGHGGDNIDLLKAAIVYLDASSF